MSTKMGLWIDHKQAVIVTMTGKESSVKQIESDVESQPRRDGDSPLKGSFEAQKVQADNTQQREMTSHLNSYYDAVIKDLQDAQSILIFGPGAAKNELKKRFVGHPHAAKIVGVETADKMTENQIVAKVRDHFSKS